MDGKILLEEVITYTKNVYAIKSSKFLELNGIYLVIFGVDDQLKNMCRVEIKDIILLN